MPHQRQTYLRQLLASLALCLVSSALVPESVAQGDGRYSEPNFDRKLFAREALLLEQQEVASTVKALAALASNFPGAEEVDHRLRAKALAVALRLDGTSPAAIDANRQLRRGEMPGAVPEFSTLAEVAATLWEIASYLESSEKGKDENVLQFCLVDIARELDPKNLGESNRYPTRLPEAIFPGWGPIVRSGSSEFVFPDRRKDKPEPASGSSTTPDPVDVPLVPTPNRTAQGSYSAIGVDGKTATLININGDLKTGGGTGPLAIVFSDEDGDTSQPLNQQRDSIVSALTELDGGWPEGGGVLVMSVATGYGDDNALILPSAILADSLIRERDLDPRTIAFGMLDPEGSIIATDKIFQRLQSFKSIDIDTILVPSDNLPELQDMALLGEIEPFLRFQIILVGSLEQAVELADAERNENDEKFAASQGIFERVQEVAKGEVINSMIELSVVREEFAKIIAATPDHASAKLLIDVGAGSLPEYLTRNGSLAALYHATGPVVAAMQKQGSAQRPVVLAAYEEVNRIQPILEPATRELGEMMSSLLKNIGTYAGISDKDSTEGEEFKAKIFSTWDTVRSEYTRLKNG
ncbi:MAG: hypothetical protein ACI9MB_003105 [Verrucomicrobiales bacterium]|jgi:hypothetical protein